MNDTNPVEVYVAAQRDLLRRLEAFAATEGMKRLREVLRQAGDEGADAWLCAWLIHRAPGLGGQIPLDAIEAGGLDEIEAHLLMILVNPS